MVLHEQRTPLRLEDRPAPEPGPGQVLLRVRACAVCRTDLHIVDGELPRPKLPVIPGHQIVARVEQGGRQFADGERFARELGAVWAGGSDEKPPDELDAALIFAPVGALVPVALRATSKGGTVVAGGIHMSDIPSFPYEMLWGERSVRSVANLTRRDGEEFLLLAGQTKLRVEVQRFPLEEANAALQALRQGQVRGAAVLVP